MAAPSPRAARASKCILEPMDLHDQSQYDELLHQRILCGWNNAPANIDTWRDAMDAKKKSLFWIKLASQPSLRAGHVSLDSEAEHASLELANPHDKSVLTIATFFVKQEHRGGGLGRAVMETLEDLATREPYGSPNCRAVAITTLSRRYAEDEEERANYERWEGRPAMARGTSNEDWYARMGYVKWKDEPLYPVRSYPAVTEKYVGAFMRKELPVA